MTPFRIQATKMQIFDNIAIKELSLFLSEPVHILLTGPPGNAKTLFLKCILETFGEKKAFFNKV